MFFPALNLVQTNQVRWHIFQAERQVQGENMRTAYVLAMPLLLFVCVNTHLYPAVLITEF